MNVWNTWFVFAITFSVQSIVLSSRSQTSNRFEVVYERKLIDYVWPSQEARRQALDDGTYIPINVAISGLKVWKNRVFVTTPRWKKGVPLTLTSITFKKMSKNAPLEAFPSWDFQKIGDCEVLQYVQSMEIDTHGKMWIIDSGRMIPISGPSPGPFCPLKLVIIDIDSVLQSNPTQKSIVKSYNFPKDVADPKTSFFNDIVLDLPNFAYITDMGSDPGIIVYDVKRSKSWKVRHSKTMEADPKFPDSLLVDGISVNIQGGNLDGIALSPLEMNRTLYYCPLASRYLYAIPTSALKKGSRVSSEIKHIGRKQSITDGMVMDNRRNLYFGIDEQHGVGIWNPKEGKSQIFAKNMTTLSWPDSFAICNNGNLWVLTNRLQRFLYDQVNKNEVNYRILKSAIDAKSYMFPSE